MPKNHTNEGIARRLRLAREQAGLTQGQVAKLLNKHRPTISEIEAGRRKVTAQELIEFAKIYGVSTAWLSGSDEDVTKDSDRLQLAARELAKLRDHDLERVLGLLRALRKGEGSD